MSLRERRDILHLANAAGEGVLVTLVRASGSSYRQAGARLLALPDGRTAGTISGGCLEADLLRKAQWRVRDGAAMQRYDTGFEDSAEIPFGLGCGGVVDLLLESRNAPEGTAVLDAIGAHLAGEFRSVVTQLPSHPLGFARMVLDGRGDVLFASDALETDRIVDLRALARHGEASGVSEEHIFVEHLYPAQRLIVCGAGEDAKPVTRLAAHMGWTVIVVDGRPQQARAERFPEAHGMHVAHTLTAVAPDTADAVVVMTHSFDQDLAFVTELLRLPNALRPRYIGLLGARHRSALLLQRAADAAGVALAEAISCVHAPVGLDLGGEGPESIALAIVAEVQHATSRRASQYAMEHAAQISGSNVAPPTPLETSRSARRMSAGDAERLLAGMGDLGTGPTRCALNTAMQTDVAGVPVLAYATMQSMTEEDGHLER